MISQTSWASPCSTPPTRSTWSSSGALTYPGERAAISTRTQDQRWDTHKYENKTRQNRLGYVFHNVCVFTCVVSCRRPCCLTPFTWWWALCKNWTAVRRSASNLSAARLLRSGSTEPASWTICGWSVCKRCLLRFCLCKFGNITVVSCPLF